MIKSYRRRQREAKQEVGRIRGLASQRAQKSRRDQHAADADTLRKRALFDAKGQLVREGCSYRDGKEIRWQVVRSVAGRVDQFDVITNGKLKDTCGRRKLRSKYEVYL